MSESKSPKSIIKTSVVKFLEHLQQQKDSLEKELSYLLEELRLNSVHIQSAETGGIYSISEVNQIVKTINATLEDYIKKTYTSISIDASRRMRLVLEDLLKLVGESLGEADITEIILKIEAFESQMSMAEEMTEKFAVLEKLTEEREAEIKKLNELLESEHLKRKEFENESTEKTKKIDALENEIARLEVELKSYVEQIDSGGMISGSRIEELETTIEERDKQIAELKTSIEEFDQSEKDDEIESLQNMIEEKNLAFLEKEKELEFLKMEMKEKGVEIKTKPMSRPISSLQFEWFPCLSMTKRKN